MFKQKNKTRRNKIKEKNDTVSDIIYIIDKIREDNIMKYSCFKTLYFFIIINIGEGSVKVNKIRKTIN